MRTGTGIVLVVAAVFVALLFIIDGDEPPPTTTEPSTTEPIALPDLRIDWATVMLGVDPDSCNGSSTCLVVWVANDGIVDAESTEDGCGTLDFAGLSQWTSFTDGRGVPADSVVEFRSGFDIIEPYMPAPFHLICDIDAADRIAESNEGNNHYETDVNP